jgi:hypothetical protein
MSTFVTVPLQLSEEEKRKNGGDLVAAVLKV